MEMPMTHIIFIGENGLVKGGADPRAGGGVAFAR
jgi:hypothetical protein